MTINLGIDKNGKIHISTGQIKVRKEDLNKWLARNSDAVLVKLNGHREPCSPCSIGHVCRIEKNDDSSYVVFVGSHVIGSLPNEAVAFADRLDTSPEFLISIVGKVEDDDVYIYIAE